MCSLAFTWAPHIDLGHGSGNGLLPDGTKPLPEPMLTFHLRCSLASTWKWFNKKCSWTYLSRYKVYYTYGSYIWITWIPILCNGDHHISTQRGLVIDGIWWHRSWSTLAKVMACCLMAPSHYLNQCWLFIKGVLWHSPENDLTRSAHEHVSV